MTERNEQIINVINQLTEHFRAYMTLDNEPRRSISNTQLSEQVVSFLLERELMFLPMETLTEESGESVGEFFSIPKAGIPALTAYYIESIQNENTNRWCRCGWEIHPEDQDKPKDSCFVDDCGLPRADDVHNGVTAAPNTKHWFRGRRMRRATEEHPFCALHNKRGLVMGFFEWLFTQEDPAFTMWNSLPAKEDLPVFDRVEQFWTMEKDASEGD